MHLDRERRLLIHGRQAALLTRSEFAIVDLLSSRPGWVKTREDLLAVAFTHDPDGGLDDRVIDSHVKRIRAKMRAMGAGDDWIATRMGEGYSWAGEAEQAAGLGKRTA